MSKLSTELRRYFLEAPPSESSDRPLAAEVTLDEIFHLAGERAFGFLFVMLSLPSALPIPAPGYSIPFGIVMGLLALQLVVGAEQPRFPSAWGKKGFERKTVANLVEKGLPWLERIEAISRPRLTGVCTSRLGRMALGIAILLMSCCMMIPIPGTNTLPAIGIFVTGFGLLDDDGVISLGGFAICVVALSLVGSILILGARAVDQFKDYVKGLLF